MKLGNLIIALLLLTAALAGTAAAQESHLQQNPLYRELLEQGLAVGDEQRLPPLPAPTLGDGLTAAQQQEALENMPGRRLPVRELIRDSVLAPYVYNISDLEMHHGLQIRTVDVWFVAHGDLKVIAENREWMDQFLREKDEVHDLTAEELAERKINLGEPADRQSVHHGKFEVLDHVQVEVTSRTMWSQTDDSQLAAGMVDSRFADDAKFPNRWRTIETKPGNQIELGPVQPYRASASYWKVTTLAEPKGALLFEYHSILEQPPEWFGGNDLLRSKLPLVMQNEVRSFRRKLKKATLEAARN